MFRKNKATAKVENGRLILSMPDAETPALWMMDLSEAMTTVIRVEPDKQGLYVLKKHGGKGAPETVGVYRDRLRAISTLNIITRTLDGAHNQKSKKCGDRLTRVLIIILFIWFAMFRLGDLDLRLVAATIDLFLPTQTQQASNLSEQELAEYDAQITEILNRMQQQKAQEQSNTPTVAPSANQAGMPQSADEFLLKRQTQ